MKIIFSLIIFVSVLALGYFWAYSPTSRSTSSQPAPQTNSVEQSQPSDSANLQPAATKDEICQNLAQLKELTQAYQNQYLYYEQRAKQDPSFQEQAQYFLFQYQSYQNQLLQAQELCSSQ